MALLIQIVKDIRTVELKTFSLRLQQHKGGKYWEKCDSHVQSLEKDIDKM